MSMEDQIKPTDWAQEHGLKVDVVMKLLRDAGVTVRTQVSKVAASDYEKIEEAAAVEKQKQDSRSKNLKSASSSESQESTPKKKSATETVTVKNGVTIRRIKATKPKATTEKPAATKTKAAAKAEEAPKAPEKAVVNVDSKNEPKKAKNSAKKNSPAQEKKPNPFKRFGRWLKSVFSDLKKVTWLKGKDVLKNTTVVLVVVVLFFVVLFIIDYVLAGLLGLIVDGKWATIFI